MELYSLLKNFFYPGLIVIISCGKLPNRQTIYKSSGHNKQNTYLIPQVLATSLPTPLPSPTLTPKTNQFSTRLNPQLLISGQLCEGGEITTFDDQGVICDAGNWLVTIDNQNTCNETLCTSIFVPAIVASIQGDPNFSNPDVNFFDILPASTTRFRQRQILREILLQEREDGQLIVIFNNFN